MRCILLTAVVVGAVVTAAPAADPLKYMPDNTGAYVHINVKQLFTAPIVRKAVPMAFDKYGEQIVGLVEMVKQFDAKAKEISEDDVKNVLKDLKNPTKIAASFDLIREFVTDIVLFSDLEDDSEKSLLLLQCNPAVTALLDLGMTFVDQSEKVSVKKHQKAGRPTVYEIEIEDIEKSFFVAVPEQGLIALGMVKEPIFIALGRTKSTKAVKVDAQLKEMIAKRNPNDFLFLAGIRGADDDREVSFASLALDKDVSGRFTVAYDSPERAKAGAQEIEQGITTLTNSLKELIGESHKALNESLEKVKAKAEGKKVAVTLTLPGSVIEKLLK
ncbi:MAG: hypothetical protein U0746_12010 [Gemmataceae bacterium]